MLQHLERLRKKPKAVRNGYAFAFASVFIVIVVAVWSLTLPAKIETIANGGGEQVEVSGDPGNRWLQSFNEIRQNLMARVTASQPGTTESAVDPSGIDLGALGAAVVTSEPTPVEKRATATEAAATSSQNGVWQRQYEASDGRPILIATTTASSTVE